VAADTEWVAAASWTLGPLLYICIYSGQFDLQCANYLGLHGLGVLALCHAFRYSRAPGNPGNDVCAFPILGNEKTGPGMQTLLVSDGAILLTMPSNRWNDIPVCTSW